MRKTDILKSHGIHRAQKLNAQFSPARTDRSKLVGGSLKRGRNEKGKRLNMRQFFNINPDLVGSHLASTQKSIGDYNPMCKSQRLFSITQKGTVIKKESIVHKISKINNALLPNLRRSPQIGSKKLTQKSEKTQATFTSRGRANLGTIFPRNLDGEKQKIEINLKPKQVKTARK